MMVIAPGVVETGEALIWAGAVAGALVTIVGAVWGISKAFIRAVDARVSWPLRRLEDKLEYLAVNLNGKMDARIDARIDAKLDPLCRRVEHIDRELSKHIVGYRKGV